MDYATPATALEGLLSGLRHPLAGIEHLLFLAGAGILTARLRRGFLLPPAFVAASVAAAALGVLAGMPLPVGALWIAATLIALGALLLVGRGPGRRTVALLFLASGAFHGYALALGIAGAARAPLLAYLAGLVVIQCAVALAAWRTAAWLAAHHPKLPVQRLAGAVLGSAGLVLAVRAALA